MEVVVERIVLYLHVRVDAIAFAMAHVMACLP